MKTICVDMDEVIADALAEHLLRYNRDFDAKVSRADLNGRWLWDYVPHDRQQALVDYMLSPDFFSVLHVMPHAQRVLAKLQTRYRVFIATAAMEVPSSFTAKYNWLQENFPFIPPSHFVFCGDKSILHADFLIDDNPRQLRLFEGREQPLAASLDEEIATRNDAESAAYAKLSFRSQARSAVAEKPAVAAAQAGPRREGILFTSPANAFVTGYRRVNDWLDVEKLFMS